MTTSSMKAMAVYLLRGIYERNVMGEIESPFGVPNG
jgi:hypothetical protein